MVLDFTKGDVQYTLEDLREITLALQNHDGSSPSLSPIMRVIVTKEFFMKDMDWYGDWHALRWLCQYFGWKAIARLPNVTDLRFHGQIGQLDRVTLLQYLHYIGNPEKLRHLEVDVGWDLIDYADNRYQQDTKELVAIIACPVDLEALLLKWRLPDATVTGKVQEILSSLVDTLSHSEHLTTLHLEPMAYAASPEPFLVASRIPKILQMKQLKHLKLAGMQFTEGSALAFVDALLANSTLSTIDFWIPRIEGGRKDEGFPLDGLREIRSMMERQVYVTSCRVESITEDEYVYWSSMSDSDLLGNVDGNATKVREGYHDAESFDHVEGSEDNYNAESNATSGSDEEDTSSESSVDEEEEAYHQRDFIKAMNMRKYLQAKTTSFCRLNAAGRARILQDVNASRNDCVDLLAVANHDIDALFSVLLDSPWVFSS